MLYKKKKECPVVFDAVRHPLHEASKAPEHMRMLGRGFPGCDAAAHKFLAERAANAMERVDAAMKSVVMTAANRESVEAMEKAVNALERAAAVTEEAAAAMTAATTASEDDAQRRGQESLKIKKEESF